MMDSESLVRYPNVFLGEGSSVDPFVILGKAPRSALPGELVLRIGEHAVIRSHTVIYAGTTIGDNFQVGHNALIREFTVIGNDCSVGSGSIIEFKVQIGTGVRLHSNVFVPEYCRLEDGCWIGPNAVLTNARFPAALRTKETLQGVTVGKRAIVGANATILPGVAIGPRALVGAGAVVTRDVVAGTVVVGSPARQVAMVGDLRYDDVDALVYPDAARSE
jgi:acetyltransferase-like isoleucine patch superfamily enzyme